MRRSLLIYAALPLAYVICGRLGSLLAVPPGYATAVFLPAGIAVTAMFMAGAATLPAIFLGSLLLNIWIGYSIGDHIGIVSIAAAAVIALASMLQAAIGGAALRHVIGYPAALDNPRDLLLLLALSPVFCLTSATLSLSGMWVLGTVQSTDLLSNWMTWWVGDTLGVMVALPLMLVIAGEPRSLWRSRAWFVAAPMVFCFGLFVAIFIRVNSWENDQSLLEFRLRSQQLADTMKATLEVHLGFLDQLSNVFIGRHQPVSRQDFHDLVQTLLQRFPTVQAVEWAPRVLSADRSTFEAAQQAEVPGFLIREQGGSRELRPAKDRDQFYPVTYVEPLVGNEPAVGFDLLSNPTRRAAIESAISGRNGTATAPIRLVQERGEQSGILLIHAVPGGSMRPGIVLVVLRMGTFASTLAGPLESTLSLRFADAAAGPPFFDEMSQTAAAAYETSFNFGGRSYAVKTAPSSDYLARHRGWQSWAVLAAGVLGTGLLGALLMLGTGHTYRIERLADELQQLATIVEASRDAIWSWAVDGTITSWNAEAERMLGYTAEEILGKSLLTLVPPERIEAAHVVISNVRKGQGVDPLETVRLRKGRTRLDVELTVSPIRDSEGQVTGAASICRDITQRKRAAETERMLVREIDHRSNNLLAIIQSIAHRSLSGDRPLAEARQAFEARLQALTRVNRQLTRSDWSGLSLKEILRQELEPFVGRTLIEGTEVSLNPQHAQNFSLVLHELATNAAKYGALSNGTGKIDVCWIVANNHQNSVLKFKWQERGGPPVVPPTHRGFGTALLNSAFTGVRLDYAAEGLSCEFELPLGSQERI